MKMKIAILLSPLLLVAAPMPAHAQTAKLYAYNFLVEVGCSQIESKFPYACTLLNPDTAVSILQVRKQMLLNENCGQPDTFKAKNMYDLEAAPEHKRCGEILKALGVIK